MSHFARELLTEERRLQLRHQALGDLRDLQRKLETSFGTWEAPRRYLTSVHTRNRLNHSLDLLHQAGEVVPPWLYKQGPLYPGALRNSKTGRPVDAVSLLPWRMAAPGTARPARHGHRHPRRWRRETRLPSGSSASMRTPNG